MNMTVFGIKRYYSHSEFIMDSYSRFGALVCDEIGNGHFPSTVHDGDEVSYIGEVYYFNGMKEDGSLKFKKKMHKVTFIMFDGAYEFTPILKNVEEIEYDYTEEEIIPYVVDHIGDSAYIKAENGGCHIISIEEYEAKKEEFFKEEKEEREFYLW